MTVMYGFTFTFSVRDVLLDATTSKSRQRSIQRSWEAPSLRGELSKLTRGSVESALTSVADDDPSFGDKATVCPSTPMLLQRAYAVPESVPSYCAERG